MTDAPNETIGDPELQDMSAARLLGSALVMFRKYPDSFIRLTMIDTSTNKLVHILLTLENEKAPGILDS